MKYQRFEDLPVWQLSIRLAEAVFKLTESTSLDGKGDLRNQLQRAVISISNNIAEGFERGSTAELLNFIYIARGSAGEVRSMLRLIEQLPATATLRQQAEGFVSDCESIARQLRAWADKLQNSDISGQKYLNDKTRTAYDQDRRARRFLDSIKMTHPPGMKPDDARPSTEETT